MQLKYYEVGVLLKKVLFIAYLFPPVAGGGVQRSSKFVKYLPHFGWELIVLTVKEPYDFYTDEELFSEDRVFSLNEILNLLEEKPEIKSINEKFVGVNWYRNHLDELKTITKNNTRNI